LFKRIHREKTVRKAKYLLIFEKKGKKEKVKEKGKKEQIKRKRKKEQIKGKRKKEKSK